MQHAAELDELGLREHLREAAGAMTADRRVEGPRAFLPWSMQIPTAQGGPLDLERFAFQADWYSEEIARAREAVWQKSTQVGMSENTWRWATWLVDVFGETVIYIFPTDVHVRDFGDERIEPAIEASDYLLGRIEPGYVHHKSLKRIGAGWLHLRGSRAGGRAQSASGGQGRAAGAQSVAAQALVFDEYDDEDPRNRAQYERRISGAKQLGHEPRVRRLGVPTVEGFGISAAYERSDQRRWHVQCGNCGQRQPIEWGENVRWTMPDSDDELRPGHDNYVDPQVVGRAWVACRSCGYELDVRDGRWVAERDSEIPGFHVSRLIVHGADLQQIVRDSRRTAPFEVEAFWNNDLGLPYSPAEASLDDATILAACENGLLPEQMAQGYAGRNAVTMGIDPSSERANFVRISEQLPDGRRRALYVGEVESFGEIKALIQNFRVHVVAVDGMAERRTVKALRGEFDPGRVVLVEYVEKTGQSEPEPIKVETGQVGTPLEGIPLKVKVHRTEAIDAAMDAIRQQRNAPPYQPPPKYVEQLKALKRRTVEDSRGRPRKVYIKTGTAGDDFMHAEVYDLIATELWRMRSAGRAYEESATRPVPDDQLGIRRMPLDAPGDYYGPAGDDYDPGLGENIPRY